FARTRSPHGRSREPARLQEDNSSFVSVDDFVGTNGPETLEFYRTRAFCEGRPVCAMLWRAFDKNRLKVAAGGCGGRGLTADPNLMAMGIETHCVPSGSFDTDRHSIGSMNDASLRANESKRARSFLSIGFLRKPNAGQISKRSHSPGPRNKMVCKMTVQKIIHIDMDAFCASVE